MIGFLRFIGVMNAAIWLGSAVFVATAGGPAFFSEEMEKVMGPAFPYYSRATAHVLLTRHSYVSLACGIVALLHFVVEWLYLGRPARKFSLGLVAGLLGLTLLNGGLEYQLGKLHQARYDVKLPLSERQAAVKSFRLWRMFSPFLNVMTIAGLVVYVWRVANPSDTLRFVTPTQFRG